MMEIEKMQIDIALGAIDAQIESLHRAGGKDSVNSASLNDLEQEKSRLSDLWTRLTANEVRLPVTPVSELELYEPSAALRHFWIGFFYERTHVPFNMVMDYAVPQLDLPSFKKTIRTIAERHEILRTVPYFCEGSQTLKQRILPGIDADSLVRMIDISAENEKEQIVEEHLALARYHVFEFRQGPPYYFTILKCGPETNIVVFNISHAVFDVASLRIFEAEFKKIYNAYCRNEEHGLEKPDIQYKDFCEWEKHFRTGAAVEAFKKYWFSQHESKFPSQNLSTLTGGSILKDHSYRESLRERIKPYLKTPDERTISAFYGVVAKAERTPSHSYCCAIDEGTFVKMNSFCRSKKVMFHVLFIAVLNATIYKRTAVGDIVIGANVALRDRKELQYVMGYLINVVLIRTRINKSHTFSQLLADVVLNSSWAFSFKYLTMSRMLDELDIPYSAINTLWLNMKPASRAMLTEFSPRHYDNGVLSVFDIDLHIDRFVNGVWITCNYDHTIYKASDITSLLDEFMVLLNIYMTAPETKIAWH